MAPFAESRNFSDTPSFGKLRHVTDSENTSRTSSVDTEDRGWWVSKTPLEQKLIILSSILFILSFCLTISVIVLDNRKPPACNSTTTVAPPTKVTSPASSSSTASSVSSSVTTKETTVSTETEAPTTLNPNPPGEGGDEEKENKPTEKAAPEVLTQYPPEKEFSARQV